MGRGLSEKGHHWQKRGALQPQSIAGKLSKPGVKIQPLNTWSHEVIYLGHYGWQGGQLPKSTNKWNPSWGFAHFGLKEMGSKWGWIPADGRQRAPRAGSHLVPSTPLLPGRGLHRGQLCGCTRQPWPHTDPRRGGAETHKQQAQGSISRSLDRNWGLWGRKTEPPALGPRMQLPVTRLALEEVLAGGGGKAEPTNQAKGQHFLP